MTYDDQAMNAAHEKRCKALAHLLGIRVTEAQDRSLTGRLAIIAKLKAARQGEVSRGQSGSWLYDVNRHLNLCAALRGEYEALTDLLANDEMDRAGAAGRSFSPLAGTGDGSDQLQFMPR